MAVSAFQYLAYRVVAVEDVVERARQREVAGVLDYAVQLFDDLVGVEQVAVDQHLTGRRLL